jgi:DNA-binding XRE family transcriptional regulator
VSRRNAAGGSAVTSAAVFGEVLRYYRDAAGLTQDQLAARLHCDRSHIARIEAGTRVPQDTFAARCDELLDTGGMLRRLWGRIDWYPEVVHPDWFQRRADMDAEATAVRAYQTQMMPGLLQTEEYAFALYARRLTDRLVVAERVRARLSRQQRFLDPDGPLYIAVLDESCLRNMIGDAAVMRAQCEHLLTVGRLPNVRVQIAPSGRPGLIRPNTSMSLITLPDGQEWVYSESLDSGHFSDDPALYARHLRAYDVLRADALCAHESAAVISDAMKGYGHHGQAAARRGDMDQVQLQRGQRRQLRRGGPRIPRPRPRA